MPMILAVLGTVLLSALGSALIMSTTTETMITNNFRRASEGLFAADAALERVLDDVRLQPDWNAVTTGAARSGFVDGVPSGPRVLPDGSTIDLGQLVSRENCRKPTACSQGDMAAVTADRPWGANNPVWRLYGYGPLRTLLPPGAIDSAFYVLVLVADDPAGSPEVLWLRAEALGPRGTHRVIESAVSRVGAAGLRVLSWREVR